MKYSSKSRDMVMMEKTLEKPGLVFSVVLRSVVFKEECRLTLENNRGSLLIESRIKPRNSEVREKL